MPRHPGPFFITFEGGEGAGKSTQVAYLAAWLCERSVAVTATREPGGAPGAEAIRRLLLEGEGDRWNPVSEALLHFAARREHVLHAIRPALERGDWVLCDRFADSTMAYQGYGHGVDREAIAALYRLVVGDLYPDLTIVMDVPIETGRTRIAGRGRMADRYERLDAAFHERLRQGYLEIAHANPGRCVVIDAAQDEAAVAAAIRQAVVERLAPGMS